MSKENICRRALHPKTRVIDEAEGLVEYIASDETLDSYSEIILAAGWKFDERFTKNPVFLNSHQMYDIRDQLGRVVSWEIRDGQLVEVVKWAKDVETNDIAKLGFEMTLKGYLKAVSVGFIPTGWVHRSDDDFTSTADAANITGETRDRVRTIYTEQQQIELSACVIGANPSALAKGIGCGDLSEELASRCGLATDTDFEFLEKAGAVIDNDQLPSEMKELARLTLLDHCRRSRKDFSTSDLSQGSAPDASTGRGASGTGTRAQGEDETRRMLETILKQTERLIQ